MEIEEAKKILNKNGYIVLKLGKGQIDLANRCELDQFDNKNCNGSCIDCMNKRCLKNIINEQIE